ncbi:TPA: hypothetical protein OZT05_000389 [Escherichia coli]|nr:hypothetical protein [Escherichia coli]
MKSILIEKPNQLAIVEREIHGVNFWHFHQRFNDMSVECCHVFLQQFLCAKLRNRTRRRLNRIF